MAIIYAQLIIKGKKKFADIPVIIKESVKEILEDMEIGYLAE